jgi:ribosomal RNA-processing protein 8
LEKESIDIAVFSLALMGTNWIEMIIESNRVLKEDGLLFIAEVSSRLEIAKFVGLLQKLGFKSLKTIQIKTFFYITILQKTLTPSKK